MRAELGWNQTLSDWHRLLALGCCFAAERNGRIVGTCTGVSFGNELAWIGMMMVDPSCRGQGIGGALLRSCVDLLHRAGVSSIKLDATPVGRPFYTHLGFRPEWTLTRWARQEPPSGSEPLPDGIVELSERHWPEVRNLDLRVSGVVRAPLLMSLARGSRRALIGERGGSVLGFGMLRDGACACYLGPVAAHPEAGEPVVRSLLTAVDEPVFWDIPDYNETAVGLARRLGFTPSRPLTRMVLGPSVVPTAPQLYWAISDPATG